MAAPSFVGIDSAGLVDNRALSTFWLQTIHQSEEYCDDERRPMATWIADVSRYTGEATLSTRRALRLSSLRWTLAGPFPVYVHAGVDTVNVRLAYATDDGTTDVVALSVQSGTPRSSDALGLALASAASYAATLADSSGAAAVASLTGIAVRPGWNDVYIAVRGAKGAAIDSASDAIVLTYDREGIPRFSPTALDVAYADTPSTSTAVPSIWIDLRDVAGDSVYLGVPLHMAYASTGATEPYDVMMSERSSGAAFVASYEWGTASWIMLLGVSVDALGLYGDATPDTRLRWYRAPGSQLLELAGRVRTAHQRRLPQIACGMAAMDPDVIHPGIRTHIRRSTASSPVAIAHWSYRTTQRVAAAETAYIEARVPLFWLGTGGGQDKIWLRTEQAGGTDEDDASVTVECVDSTTLTAAHQSVGVSRYNAPTSSDSGTPFQTDGCVVLGDEDDLWTWATVRVPIADLTADTVYRIVLEVSAVRGTAGRVVVGNPGVRLVVE